MVKHIRKYYGTPTYIDAVTCTHGDDDHSSGLREVIKDFEVGSIWMNRPWLYASSIIDAFKGKRMTVASLARHLREEYPILAEIEALATERGFPIHEAFQGEAWGAFPILAPSRERYIELIPEFSRTTEQAESRRSHPSIPTGLLGASVLEVKGDFHECLEQGRVHAGTSAEGAEGCQRRFARRRASARLTSLRMTATRATLGCLPRSRRRL